MTSEEFLGRVDARAGAAGLRLHPGLAARLETYYRLLFIWNQKINLTALNLSQLPDDAVDRLFIEPVVAAGHAASGERVLDVGSGGGSPAIPFALASSASALTMVESRSRKSVFLREAARAVALPDARVLTARFEDVSASPEMHAQFDVVTIRAVRIEDADWARLRAPLRSHGTLLFLHQAGLSTPQVEGYAGPATHPLTKKSELSVWQRLG